MKKLIALIVTLCIVATMSLTSFAAVTVTSGEGDAIKINATATDEEGVFTFDEATTTFETTTEATSGNGQTTILAVAGYNNSAASITTTSIQYINQGTEKNFTFALKEGLITEENPNAVVTILMGGDGMPSEAPVATVATLTIATEVEAPTMYTVTFKNGADELPVQYQEGTVGVEYTGDTPTKAEDENFTYTFVGWYDSETQADVDLATLTVTKDITLIAKFDAKAKEPAGGEDTETITLSYGDVNGDEAVNGIDAALIIQKGVGLVDGFYDSESREIPETVGDVNADTAVNGIDAALIIQKGVGLVDGFYDADENPLTTYTYTYVTPDK